MGDLPKIPPQVPPRHYLGGEGGCSYSLPNVNASGPCTGPGSQGDCGVRQYA